MQGINYKDHLSDDQIYSMVMEQNNKIQNELYRKHNESLLTLFSMKLKAMLVYELQKRLKTEKEGLSNVWILVGNYLNIDKVLEEKNQHQIFLNLPDMAQLTDIKVHLVRFINKMSDSLCIKPSQEPRNQKIQTILKISQLFYLSFQLRLDKINPDPDLIGQIVDRIIKVSTPVDIDMDQNPEQCALIEGIDLISSILSGSAFFHSKNYDEIRKLIRLTHRHNKYQVISDDDESIVEEN